MIEATMMIILKRGSKMMTAAHSDGSCDGDGDGGPQELRLRQRKQQQRILLLRPQQQSLTMTMMTWTWTCLLFLAAHLYYLPTATATIMFNIHPYEEECFILRTPVFIDGRSRLLSGTFAVLDDDDDESENDSNDKNEGDKKSNNKMKDKVKNKRNEPISMVVMDATDPQKLKHIFHTIKNPKSSSTVFRIPVGNADVAKKYMVCLRNNVANKNINAAEARRRIKEDEAKAAAAAATKVDNATATAAVADTNASADDSSDGGGEDNKNKYNNNNNNKKNEDRKVYTIGFSHRLVALGRARPPSKSSTSNATSTTNSTEEEEEAEDVHAQMTSSWQTQAILLEDVMTHLKDHQEYMRAREMNHRNMAEKTFTETLTYTLMEVTALCMIAMAQVLYIRRYLEKKRYGM
jgi:emp24/gp25L/p24 family/GOLD